MHSAAYGHPHGVSGTACRVVPRKAPSSLGAQHRVPVHWKQLLMRACHDVILQLARSRSLTVALRGNNCSHGVDTCNARPSGTCTWKLISIQGFIVARELGSVPTLYIGPPFPQLRMSKKIAQLTKVIYHLNNKNEDNELDLQELAEQYETEIEQILKDTADKINHFKAQLDAANDAARIAELTRVRSWTSGSGQPGGACNCVPLRTPPTVLPVVYPC